MTNLILQAERVLRHTQRLVLRCCAFCDRGLGLADRPLADRRGRAPAPCRHERELLAQARARFRTLGRVPRLRGAPGGPWVQRALGEPGLDAPEGSQWLLPAVVDAVAPGAAVELARASSVA